ncbi:hypothetical protein Vadar_032911 [Vaccinium darrowii]|uniref:Uncharacterized protein n=1 Tax=Vaccinium darrowii TaxID=229202 RepID=A0ACB7YTH5_9ERIC|nr:hypothetical protein Vadar_032911 [Vaccinium darrowii]
MGSSVITTAAIAFFFCFLINIANFHVCFCNGISSSSNNNHNITCFENEREALLKFKQDLKANFTGHNLNRLSSWDIGEDCCQWAGVVCDNFTGHVREIRLQSPSYREYSAQTDAGYESYLRYKLRGKVNPSLLDLKHLQYLDLSNNDFEGTHIPSFLGSMTTLRYLNLSRTGFFGTIPPQLGNVTAMRYLDLGYNGGLLGGNLQWLSGLVSLQHLDMSFVNVSKASDCLQVMRNLPSLVELHLSGWELEYVVSPSTNKINFTSLDILDVSYAYLGSCIPGWIFSLNHLVSLDMSSCFFNCPFPSGIENMAALRALDLSWNAFNSTIPNGLYSLSHLESLNLGLSIWQGVISSAIGNLTSLVSLDLSNNQLQGSIPASLGKLCMLKTIDLSYNNFYGEVADVFKGFSRCKSHSLETFITRWNNLIGHLPYELGQLKSLAYFDLRRNSFSGPIPESIGRLSSLKMLYLSDNKFKGTLPESLGQLGKLEVLHIYDNSLKGVVSDAHFANLTRLRRLNAGGNNLTLKASENWVPPFQVEDLYLDSWQLGPQFPLWLPSQRKLTSLSIANTNISDSIPTLFWPVFSKLQYANLSRNQIHGEVPSLPSNSWVDLSSNCFNGSLPLISSNLSWLDLSNNSFSGSIYHVLCGKGEEPLLFLNLGNNLLSGKIPDCCQHWQELYVVRLENNNLVGSIPNSIGQLLNLQPLHLRRNHLSWELPPALQSCSSLFIMDLGENKFTGSIPPWMGSALLGLMVLNLHSNNFSDHLPHELCRLSALQILDVARNNLSGHVPRCFANFSAMAKINDSRQVISFPFPNEDGVFPDNTFVVTK